jgi:hypothetical protein
MMAMKAAYPANPTGTIKASQKVGVVAILGHPHVKKPMGKIDSNANAEQSADATTNPPRPKAAAKMPGSTQMIAIRNQSNDAE